MGRRSYPGRRSGSVPTASRCSRSACRQWAFLLLAGPYHVGNHGTDKTLTVPGSGVDEQPAGTQDMERLAGMIHQLPLTVVITLAGRSAAPPCPR